MSQRIIFHVDLDAFFASCEVLKNPNLKGKPVVIGADPKSGYGRGVVSTASYEARKFGIHSAQPISTAYRLSQGRAIFLAPDFKFYQKISARIMKILMRYADIFESGGIDEAYLDVSKRVGDFNNAKTLAQKIKNEIKEKTGLTCSIGIAPNKLLAKIGSAYKKPDGMTIILPRTTEYHFDLLRTDKSIKNPKNITQSHKHEPVVRGLPSEVLEFLAPLRCRELIGVGPKTEQKLLAQGIKTVADLRKLPREKLVDFFGKFGNNLYEYSRGIDDSEVKEGEGRKSISAEHTFEKDTKNPYLILATLNKLAQEVFQIVKKDKISFKQVAIKVRFENFETHTRQNVLPDFSTQFYEIKTKGRELIAPFLKKGRAIRLIGVRVGQLGK